MKSKEKQKNMRDTHIYVILGIIILIILVVLIVNQDSYITISSIKNIEEECTEQTPFDGDRSIIQGDSITFNISANEDKNGKIIIDFVRIKDNVVNINWKICKDGI